MKWLIGIDEAGRGPLAGPVSVAVFACLRRQAVQKNQKNKLKVLRKAKDSKILNHEQRELIFAEIEQEKKKGNCLYAVTMTSSSYIDTYGIIPAIKQAMKLSLKKLKLKAEECEVLLDGSLEAPVEYKNQKTIIKGDAKIPVISAASICAKVLRDRYMTKVAKAHPHYDFQLHKGYGTKKHREAISKHGICGIHRKSFLKNLL